MASIRTSWVARDLEVCFAIVANAWKLQNAGSIACQFEQFQIREGRELFCALAHPIQMFVSPFSEPVGLAIVNDLAASNDVEFHGRFPGVGQKNGTSRGGGFAKSGNLTDVVRENASAVSIKILPCAASARISS